MRAMPQIQDNDKNGGLGVLNFGVVFDHVFKVQPDVILFVDYEFEI